MSIKWSGVTQTSSLSEEAVAARHRLDDAVAQFQWDRVIALLEEDALLSPNDVRLGGDTLNTPLHHAALGHAPFNVVKRLIELGASRSLRNTRNERAIDIARTNGVSNLFDILEPVLHRAVPSADVELLERHLHEVIKDRVGKILDRELLRLPPVELLLEAERPSLWFAIPGMYGGFSISLDGEGDEAQIVTESWSRVCEGSGKRHLITRDGVILTAEGFV